MTSTIPTFPEPDGYRNLPGFVKSNPKNNPSYLALSSEMLPEMASHLSELDKQIEELAPGYNIVQIKEKFGELRYHYDLPPTTTQVVYLKVRALVSAVEAQSYELLN